MSSVWFEPVTLWEHEALSPWAARTLPSSPFCILTLQISRLPRTPRTHWRVDPTEFLSGHLLRTVAVVGNSQLGTGSSVWVWCRAWTREHAHSVKVFLTVYMFTVFNWPENVQQQFWRPCNEICFAWHRMHNHLWPNLIHTGQSFVWWSSEALSCQHHLHLPLQDFLVPLACRRTQHLLFLLYLKLIKLHT